MYKSLSLILFFISMIKAQPSYEFEIFSIPNMETPLGINSNGTKIVGTNFGGQAVFWSDSTSTIAYGTGELWDISEDGRIFAELENSDENWEAALIENGETSFIGNVEGGNTCDNFFSHGLSIS